MENILLGGQKCVCERVDQECKREKKSVCDCQPAGREWCVLVCGALSLSQGVVRGCMRNFGPGRLGSAAWQSRRGLPAGTTAPRSLFSLLVAACHILGLRLLKSPGVVSARVSYSRILFSRRDFGGMNCTHDEV